MIRRAVVAGSFYSGTRDRLQREMDALYPEAAVRQWTRAIVAPHAGYVYSGRVAAAVYSRVLAPETWVIIGPNHRGTGARAAIMTSGAWDTPLGTVPIDAELAEAILAQSQALSCDATAHAREHSIEVQLPFVQRESPGGRFVPISLAASEYPVCRDIGQAVASAIRGSGRKAVVVASTDMSHYVSRDEAARRDRQAIDAILALNPELLHRVVSREGITMCGFHAVATTLVAATALGATSAELVQYTDSGAVTGDTTEVVAYLGMLVR